MTLSLCAEDLESGVTQMSLSNDGFTWSNWEPYNTSKSWTLTSGNGPKSVFARFKNGAGLVSIPVGAQIILYVTVPVVPHDVIYDQITYVVETCSNSTLTDLEFNQTESKLQFSVNGTDGTSGFFIITIPAELMSGTFSILKDSVPLVENLDYTQTFNGTHYTFSMWATWR